MMPRKRRMARRELWRRALLIMTVFGLLGILIGVLSERIRIAEERGYQRAVKEISGAMSGQ